jgi:hypothetical protein
MFRLYDRAFKVGFALTILAFFAINIGKYIIASREHAVNRARFMLAPAQHFPQWGFPFVWGHNFWHVVDGLVLNFVVIVTTSFIVGLIFRQLNLIFSRPNH